MDNRHGPHRPVGVLDDMKPSDESEDRMGSGDDLIDDLEKCWNCGHERSWHDLGEYHCSKPLGSSNPDAYECSCNFFTNEDNASEV